MVSQVIAVKWSLNLETQLRQNLLFTRPRLMFQVFIEYGKSPMGFLDGSVGKKNLPAKQETLETWV